MKSLLAALCVLAIAGSAGFSRAQTPAGSDGLASLGVLLQESHEAEDSGPALTLDDAEKIALAANP